MIRRAWTWFWHGRLCKRCKVERTARLFVDEVCTTCWVVEIIKWNRP